MDIKSSNPKAFGNILAGLDALDGVQSKVGWFESAKYENGTPVAFVAAVQELGAPSRSIPPRPFMRTSAAEKQQEWRDIAGQMARRVLNGQATAEQAMEVLAMKAEGDVSQKIADIDSPPLSPLTLAARKYRQQGKKVTGATLGELSRKLAEGSIDISGVSTKPLNYTGHMIATLTHVTESTK